MESFKFKLESELQEQVQSTEETLNHGHEDLTSILADGEAVFSMSEEELSKKYKRRYLTYVELLRKVRSGESVDEGEFEKEYQIIKALNTLKEYIHTHKEGGTEKFTLRERQIETLQKISDWLEAGGTKGHIVMPTGCGKTVIFLTLVEAMGLKTFICEPTQIIQDQVITEIQEKTDMEEVTKRNAQKKDISKQVVVTTYHSLLSDVKNARLSENELDLVIRDEAHKSLGENISTALNLVGGIQIGFTATEDYGYKNVADQLPDCIDELDPIEAIRLKMISGYKNWVVGTDISLQGIKFDGSKEDDDLLEKAVDITKRNMVAVDIYKNAFQASNSQGVCFCSGITHSKNVAELFNSEGITARHIDGDTSISERKEILAAYKRGEISILTCSDVLIEGFDEKQVDVVFNLAPSQSKVRVMQRGGRALRQDEDRETPKVAHIFDFEDKDSKAIPYGYYLETDDTSTIALEDEQRFPEKEEKARKDYESIREQIMNISKGLQTALEGTANVVYDKDLYNEYLGRVDERFEKRTLISYADLKSEVDEWIRDLKVQGIKPTITVYQKHVKESKKLWPLWPDSYTEWPEGGWREFLGTNRLPYEELKQKVQSWAQEFRVKNLRNPRVKDYIGWVGSDNEETVLYPKTESAFVKGVYSESWTNWDDFLGNDEQSLEFLWNQIKQKVHLWAQKFREENSKDPTNLDYKKFAKENGLIEQMNDTPLYKKFWKGWGDFLGKSEEINFSELRDRVRNWAVEFTKANYRIPDGNDYRRESKQNNFPPVPYKYDEFTSMEDFLNRKECIRIHWEMMNSSVKEWAQNFRDKHDKNPTNFDYKDYAREHNLTILPQSSEYKDFWKGWDDFLGNNEQATKFLWERLKQRVQVWAHEFRGKNNRNPTSVDYKEYAKENGLRIGIDNKKEGLFKIFWNGWNDFLGND